MKIYPERINRDYESSDVNKRIQEAYMRVINPMLDEDSTADANKTLNAIIGALKDQKDNDIYKMAVSMKKSYEKNKGFSEKQADWIYKVSKSLFK